MPGMCVFHYSFKHSPEHAIGPRSITFVCCVLMLGQKVVNNIRYLLQKLSK